VADQQQNDDSNLPTDIELERLKMYQDSFKHLMTFSSGAILLASAVTGALFPKPDAVGMLVFSIVMFAIAALLAIAGFGLFVPLKMDSVVLPRVIYRRAENPDESDDMLGKILWLSCTATSGGLIAFGVFAFTNLTPKPFG
jgi:hypothetical protein